MGSIVEIEEQRFEGATVRLDGHAYVRCVLTRCVLEYHGTGPIRLDACELDECRLQYHGAAAATVEALRSIAKSGPLGLDHVMRLFLPTADIDWQALATPVAAPRRRAK